MLRCNEVAIALFCNRFSIRQVRRERTSNVFHHFLYCKLNKKTDCELKRILHFSERSVKNSKTQRSVRCFQAQSSCRTVTMSIYLVLIMRETKTLPWVFLTERKENIVDIKILSSHVCNWHFILTLITFNLNLNLRVSQTTCGQVFCYLKEGRLWQSFGQHLFKNGFRFDLFYKFVPLCTASSQCFALFQLCFPILQCLRISFSKNLFSAVLLMILFLTLSDLCSPRRLLLNSNRLQTYDLSFQIDSLLFSYI